MFYIKEFPDLQPLSGMWKYNLTYSWSLTPNYLELFMVPESYAVPRHQASGRKAHWLLVISHSLDYALFASSLQVQQLSAASAPGLKHRYFYQDWGFRAWGLMNPADIPFWSPSCSLPNNTTQKCDPGTQTKVQPDFPNWSLLGAIKPVESSFLNWEFFYFHFLQAILSLPAISLIYWCLLSLLK